MFLYDKMRIKAENIGKMLYNSRNTGDIRTLQARDSYKRYLSRQCRDFSEAEKTKIEKAAIVYNDYFSELENLQWRYMKIVNDILMGD